ncbi:hypothetical protein ACFWBR_42445 [Streptomyces sp. NPDC060006]|uniref:hypothetical protein n=1 Tax=unclassified Streptomyces TaxID=2593676 RepID=UPI0036A733E4
MITSLVLFYVLLGIGLYFAALFIANQLVEARPLPRLTQELPPPLPGTYVVEVRSRIPGRLGRRARPSSARCGLLLPCEGTCRGRTRHEDDGDGTATCVPCGTPRPAAATDGD